MDFAIVMVARYSFSALNISLLMAPTSKAICDVAGMRAIFSVGIAVGSEGFTAMRATVGIDGLLVYHLGVSVPPGLPALVTAKQQGLLIWFLQQFFATVFTVGFFVGRRGGIACHHTSEVVLSAI